MVSRPNRLLQDSTTMSHINKTRSTVHLFLRKFTSREILDVTLKGVSKSNICSHGPMMSSEFLFELPAFRI